MLGVKGEDIFTLSNGKAFYTDIKTIEMNHFGNVQINYFMDIRDL